MISIDNHHINELRDEYTSDLLLALDKDVRPPSTTMDGACSILQRLSSDANIDYDHEKHEYLAPHGGRRGMDEVLVRAFGRQLPLGILTTPKRRFENAILTLRPANLETLQRKHSLR